MRPGNLSTGWVLVALISLGSGLSAPTRRLYPSNLGARIFTSASRSSEDSMAVDTEIDKEGYGTTRRAFVPLAAVVGLLARPLVVGAATEKAPRFGSAAAAEKGGLGGRFAALERSIELDARPRPLVLHRRQMEQDFAVLLMR